MTRAFHRFGKGAVVGRSVFSTSDGGGASDDDGGHNGDDANGGDGASHGAGASHGDDARDDGRAHGLALSHPRLPASSKSKRPG